MSVTDCLGESWNELRGRLLAERRVTEWAQLEPDLHGMTDPQQIRDVVADRAQFAQTDQLFAALLRLAATDGGDDRNAALLLAHLMAPAASLLARSLQDLSPDIDWVVASALWTEIRSYRWRVREHGHALGLKLDTRTAVIHELADTRGRDGRRLELPVGPDNLARLRTVDRLEAPTPRSSQPERQAAAVEALLRWARHHSVLSAPEVQLLLDFELAEPEERAHVTRLYGVTDRHLRRQCFRLKDRLRAAVAEASITALDAARPAHIDRAAPPMSARGRVFTSGGDHHPIAR
ncbi:MAG: hypothetical protein ACTHMS_03245 [Jatrophihabitans sp.]|uniref:hypothetical protein n=1 Tax=Jatrophihabitans sp. TaxID=1932789 RepID=UPI003F7D72CC